MTDDNRRNRGQKLRQRACGQVSASQICNRTGFSLIEVMIATTMTAFLTMLIAGIWAGFARAMSDTVAQARLFSDAHLALESFRRDLGGSLPESTNGTKTNGRMVGRLATGDGRLLLCFDGGGNNAVAEWAPPDTVIVYEVQGRKLLRTDRRNGATFVVAENISDFKAQQLANGLSFELTVERGDFSRTYMFVSEDP